MPKIESPLKAVLLDLYKSVRWTGGTGVALSPDHNIMVMIELRRPYSSPRAYTLRKYVHGCTHSSDTKEEVSSECKNFGYSLSSDNFYHPARDNFFKSKI